ncbi:MAG: Rab family GTPase [Thermoplasmata archaeon]
MDAIEIKRKICLLGAPGVGKTNMIKRYVYNLFDEKYITTIGTNVTKKVLKLVYASEGKSVDLTMMIWDLEGYYAPSSLTSVYYLGSKGGMFVCDLTRRETLQGMDERVNAFFNKVGTVPIVFIGNKKDLVDKIEIKEEEIAELAMKYKAPYFLTSAKTSENVVKAFYVLGDAIARESLKQ